MNQIVKVRDITYDVVSTSPVSEDPRTKTYTEITFKKNYENFNELYSCMVKEFIKRFDENDYEKDDEIQVNIYVNRSFNVIRGEWEEGKTRSFMWSNYVTYNKGDKLEWFSPLTAFIDTITFIFKEAINEGKIQFEDVVACNIYHQTNYFNTLTKYTFECNNNYILGK